VFFFKDAPSNTLSSLADVFTACSDTDKCYIYSVTLIIIHENHMGIILWIILGGLAGWLASILMGTNANQGFFLNILVGIIGAVIGGWVMSFLGGTGVTGFNLWSLCVAILGAAIFLGLLQHVRG